MKSLKDSIRKITFKDVLFGLIVPLILFFLGNEFSKSQREPTFYKDPVKTVIISNAEDLPIQFEVDGTKVKKDLTAETFYFFNQGRTIKKTDVYSPIEITVSDSITKIIKVIPI